MIGRPARRREDLRFLTGRGCYVADLALDHAAHVAVVRSLHAHARILRVDASAARALSGVLGVFTLDDLPELRDALPPPVVPGVAVKPYRQSALADGVVRFAGEPIAVVVATDPYAAADGAAAVGVAYAPLPVAVDPERAVEPGGPLVHADWGSNVAATVTLEMGNLEAALRQAALVVTRRVRCGRLTALPLEPRALAGDGTILGLADDFLIDAGAYLPRGAVVAGVTAAHLVGLYRVPAFRCRGRVVVTHKVPSAPYRGAGRPQATFVAERLMDIAARELGLDPADLRRRNLIVAAEMPYDRGLLYRDGMPMVHDSGDYPALLAKALEGAGYATFRARQAAARGQGRLLGIGIAAYNEATGIGPHEGACVTVEESGRVRVTVGAPSQGQGHETILAQICADRLGVPLGSIEVTAGDTAR